MIAASAIAIFLIPVAYAIEHLFSAWKSAREQEVAERPLGSAIAAQREFWCIPITSANLFLQSHWASSQRAARISRT